MCKQSTCSTCQKTTWWGCGSHIPQVLDSVPQAERCTCDPKVERDGKSYPPAGPFINFKAMFGFGGGPQGEGKEDL